MLTIQLEIWIAKIRAWRDDAEQAEDLATLADISAVDDEKRIAAREAAAFARGQQMAFDRLIVEIQLHRDRLDRQKRAGL
jgi:hypothetical protein